MKINELGSQEKTVFYVAAYIFLVILSEKMTTKQTTSCRNAISGVFISTLSLPPGGCTWRGVAPPAEVPLDALLGSILVLPPRPPLRPGEGPSAVPSESLRTASLPSTCTPVWSSLFFGTFSTCCVVQGFDILVLWKIMFTPFFSFSHCFGVISRRRR